MKIDNQKSERDLKQIKLELVRELECQQQSTLNAEPYREQQSLIRNQFVGLCKHETEQNQFDIKLTDITLDPKSNKELYLRFNKHKNKKANNLELQFIENIPPSCKSALINCQYYLKFKFSHSGVIIGKKLPIVKLPVWITCPQQLSQNSIEQRLSGDVKDNQSQIDSVNATSNLEIDLVKIDITKSHLGGLAVLVDDREDESIKSQYFKRPLPNRDIDIEEEKEQFQNQLKSNYQQDHQDIQEVQQWIDHQQIQDYVPIPIEILNDQVQQ
eukprot:403355592